MNVPSYEFLVFAAIAAAIINISSAPSWRRGTLLVANVAFALSFGHDPAQLVPFAALLALGFASVKLLEKNRYKALFVLLLVAQTIAFCWLKRYTFIPHGILLSYAYVTVGMSYVFFRILHLVIDAYQDALPERIGIVSYFNYTLSFTSLVSGPIQLYRDYRRSEVEEPPPLTRSALAGAVQRIVLGFFKVSIVSPVLLYAHERCVAGTMSPGVVPYAAAVAIFPIYLYANFSGYTDVVIGTARFLRLEIPENFDKPFEATGFIEFWGRWHMTLSNWLKTYVYSPLVLGLMRRYPSAAAEPYLGVFANFVTFFLVGAWHGQTTMFLFFGILQGAGVSANKLYQIAMTRRLGRKRYRIFCAKPGYAAVSRGLMFSYFAITLLWFWLTAAQLERFASALGIAGITCVIFLLILVTSMTLWAVSAAGRWLSCANVAGSPLVSSPFVRTAWYTALIVITLSVTVVLKAPSAHIVYRAF